MKLSTVGIALKGASSAYNYLRENGKKKERELYDALLEAVKDGNLGDFLDNANLDEVEDLYDSARREAGDVTRDIHDRLDRRRAAFAAAAPDRKARREALVQDDSKGGAGKAFGILLVVAGTAAAGWAAWEFWLKDKLAEDERTAKTTARTEPAPTHTETKGTGGTDSRGTSTLVYSTRTEDDREAASQAGSAGPLGEEPAERDEELLASIDEQLTTLDALDDDQREATAPTHTHTGDEGEGGKHERR